MGSLANSARIDDSSARSTTTDCSRFDASLVVPPVDETAMLSAVKKGTGVINRPLSLAK
jgi:hypothetical protein